MRDEDKAEQKKRRKKGEEVAKRSPSNLKITDEGVVAVDDFNLEIADKEFIVIVGPSGCGKSTTMRMIAGLEDITRGEIYLNGRLINDVEPRDRDIAMVFQNYALYPHMTVRQNLEFPLDLRNMPKDEMDRKAQNYDSSTSNLILVNKSRHLVNFYQGSKGHWVNIKRNILCTIGKKSSPTKSGNFKLSLKVTKNGKYGRKDFKGTTAFYAFRINAGNFFHSVLYRKGCSNPYTSSPVDATLGKSISNSCIRLPLADAKFIWDNMKRGTRVVVY